MAKTQARCPAAATPSLAAAIDADITLVRSVWSDYDLVVLLLLILADTRVFRGSPVASFTLYELFVWGYCTPFVIGWALATRRMATPVASQFTSQLLLYLSWVLLASLFALLGRQHAEVLQQAKNILPALPLTCFLLIRLGRPGTFAVLANLYVLYCAAACAVALLQLSHGGPYFRPPIDNNEYKLGYGGEVVDNVVLGFSSTPNELAVVVLPGLMFSAIKLVHELRHERRPPRLLTAACCMVTGLPFVLADSRGAVAAFIFGFVFMVGPTRRSRSFPLKLTLSGAAILLLVVFGLHAGADAVSRVENTMLGRTLLWQTAIGAATSDPYVAVLGDGLDYVTGRSWLVAGWEFPDAHNGWLDQALFFGAPALLLYLSIWRRFFIIVDTAAVSGGLPPSELVLLDGIRASVLAYVVLYFFEPVAHAVFPVSQLFLLMSAGVALSTHARAV